MTDAMKHTPTPTAQQLEEQAFDLQRKAARIRAAEDEKRARAESARRAEEHRAAEQRSEANINRLLAAAVDGAVRLLRASADELKLEPNVSVRPERIVGDRDSHRLPPVKYATHAPTPHDDYPPTIIIRAVGIEQRWVGSMAGPPDLYGKLEVEVRTCATEFTEHLMQYPGASWSPFGFSGVAPLSPARPVTNSGKSRLWEILESARVRADGFGLREWKSIVTAENTRRTDRFGNVTGGTRRVDLVWVALPIAPPPAPAPAAERTSWSFQ